MRILIVAISVAVLPLASCRRSGSPSESAKIATSTSYLEAAVHDLLGDDINVVRLVEPGTCPGHFDIRPSQVAELRRCRVLFRFDFQKSLDARIAGTNADCPRVAEIVLGNSSMCRPDNYLAACRQIANSLVELDLLTRARADARLQSISSRLDALSRSATSRLSQAGLVGSPTIASARQRDFCQWLGLDVVATFSAADAASIGEVENAIDAGRTAQIRIVIANLPEGRRIADALADRLKARVAVFENFPVIREGALSFDAMFCANLDVLLRATAP